MDLGLDWSRSATAARAATVACADLAGYQADGLLVDGVADAGGGFQAAGVGKDLGERDVFGERVRVKPK